MEKLILSPSRVKKWVRCKRSYYWRYNQKLVRIRKEVPMSLGSVVGEALARYYNEDQMSRTQEVLDYHTNKTLKDLSPKAEAITKDPTLKGDWEKITRISRTLLSTYHEWALPKDTFEVVSVETTYQVELTPSIYLIAIPDTVVKDQHEGLPLILEHKVRYRYRPGDFNLDYQSVGSCLASGAIGTIYNVLEYSKTKYHRTPHIRDRYELDYFRDIFIHIGEDILRTPPEDLYPMPMGRCHCEYFELCNAEQTGLDIEDIVNELYTLSKGKPEEEKPEEPEE